MAGHTRADEDSADEPDRGVQHLFALSWLPGVEPPAAFAMLVAYMDESGTHDPTGVQPGSDVAAIAGYVSTYKAWVRFQREWGKVLRRYGVQGRFHMNEYTAQKEEFEGWSNEKRASFMVALIKVIDQYKLFGLGGIVSVKEYDSILPEWAKAEVKHPYYFCFAVLMKTLAQYDLNIPSGRIDFVFDRKEGYQGFTDEMFNNLKKFNPKHAARLGELSFRSGNLKPLQAADLLVYEVRRHASALIGAGGGRPTRQSMRALMNDQDLIVGRADADYLRGHVDARKRQLGLS